MNSLTDDQLLRDYTGRRSEAAFAELVRRHVDLVYSAALRMVRDAHLAEDVTQAVFVALAQNARQLADRPVLSGWLHRTTQNLAANAVRSDVRRRAREQEAAAMNELLSAEPDTMWEHIAPHLDAALGELSEPDRDALLLRYFERKSASEMAQTLGISDEAAQKRVSRAVERLREFLVKRGVTAGASGLVVVISANAVQGAPVGLAITISTAAVFAGTTIATTATATAIKTINWLNIKSISVIVVAVVIAGAGTHLLEQRETTRLRNDNQDLIAGREKLTNERDAVLSAASATRGEIERLQKNQTELLRLRGELARLRAGPSVTSVDNQDGLSSHEVIKQSREQYASLTSYSDTGRIATEFGGLRIAKTFAMRLGRPNLYRIYWEQPMQPMHSDSTNFGVLGSKDNYDFLKKWDSFEMQSQTPVGLAGTKGTFSGAKSEIPGTLYVPGSFFGINWANQLGSFAPTEKRQKDERIGGFYCYVLTEEIGGRTTTLWIGKKDLLVHQVRQVSAEELQAQTDSQIADALTRAGKSATPEAIAELRGRMENAKKTPAVTSTTETHENISVNHEFTVEDFVP